MARSYTRPELSAEDLKLLQAGKCVMINPSQADIALALKRTEKGCRKNKLQLQVAQAALQTVNNREVLSSGAGQWSCPGHFQYGFQGTVLQVVRLSENLIGLYCDRQDVVPGQSSSYPVPFFSIQDKREEPTIWMNRVLTVFWMYLSDEEIAQIERDVVYLVMENAASHNPEIRRKILDTLYRGVPPRLVSEYQVNCLKIAQELREKDLKEIPWNQFKKDYPSLVARYQAELMLLTEDNKLRVEQLESVKTKTPYNLFFSLWTGPQRLFDQPQIVLSICNFNIHREFDNCGEEYQKVSRKLKQVAGRQCHPGTAMTIGWLRIHVDDERKLCFVDEVQSDTLEAARQINNEAARNFLNQCTDWQLHGFATICQWAREIGYRAAIHSRDSAAEKPDMTQSDRKWNTYYRPIIKRFGLTKASFDTYPADIWVSVGSKEYSTRKNVN